MSVPKVLQQPIHMAGGAGMRDSPAGCLTLQETVSVPKCHSVSTFLSNKVDMLFFHSTDS